MQGYNVVAVYNKAADITLTHFIDFTYHLDNCYVEVHVEMFWDKLFPRG